MKQQTKTLIETANSNYKRSYYELGQYLFQNIDTLHTTIHTIGESDFKSISGVLESFFEKFDIVISVIPNIILKSKSQKTKHLWSYLMYVDGAEVFEGDFPNRETAQYLAFLKAFQFLDTKLFIKLTKNRFEDESSDISCLNMNWTKLDEVIMYRRKNLLTTLDSKTT